MKMNDTNASTKLVNLAVELHRRGDSGATASTTMAAVDDQSSSSVVSDSEPLQQYYWCSVVYLRLRISAGQSNSRGKEQRERRRCIVCWIYCNLWGLPGGNPLSTKLVPDLKYKSTQLRASALCDLMHAIASCSSALPLSRK